MSGTLFLVSTPIGNLEDITLRALRVLREADLIAAEDTRRTAKLLAHYAISRPTISFHQHNIRSRLPQLLARLERGDTVALVSDAGTPGISDPGVELVRACAEKGLPVDPVPGASAPLVAAIASGFPMEPMTIFGFAPSRAKDRKAWLERIQTVSDTFTFFEVPHRIRQTLAEIASMFGNRPIMVGRELTKLHQQFLRGRSADIIGQLTNPVGEFTIVVGPIEIKKPAGCVANDREIWNEFGRSTVNGCVGRRAAIVGLARKYGRSPKEVYAIIERMKDSGV
ncbi:MAG: 16S rRNA (cytidine(1402)-2'-O)-methyltransferase [Acidobacteria bacterium]|nr:16S rRNA (cytidine(1402)-2'-O)-methyltransferase [Acidobacteriota bacterium]